MRVPTYSATQKRRIDPRHPPIPTIKYLVMAVEYFPLLGSARQPSSLLATHRFHCYSVVKISAGRHGSATRILVRSHHLSRLRRTAVKGQLHARYRNDTFSPIEVNDALSRFALE